MNYTTFVTEHSVANMLSTIRVMIKRTGHLILNVDTVIVYLLIVLRSKLFDKYLNKYHRQHKPADSGDLAAQLMMIHNEKYPDRQVMNVSRSTLTRISQQYKLSSKRVSLVGPAKSKLKSIHKRDRQLDIDATLSTTCNQFSNALQSMSGDVVRRTWDRLRTRTPEQLKCKSSTSSLQRTKSTPIHSNSQQPFFL